MDSLLNFSMARAIYEWASGSDFLDVMEHTHAQEGTVVRTI